MSTGKKTPQEKKALDLKNERRFHQNNDKSARSWIPSAKRRTHKAERKTQEAIVRSAFREGSEEELTSAQLRSSRSRERIHKDGSETLSEHISHQLERRRSLKPKSRISSGWIDVGKLIDTEFHMPSHLRPFRDLVRRLEGSVAAPSSYLKEQAELCERALESDSIFFRGLFREEPGLKSRLIKVLTRIRKRV